MCDVRRHDRLIASLAEALADEILDDLADDGPLGMPKNEPAAGRLFNGEEAELGAEPPMIAPAALFEARQVRVELRLVVPSGPVDPLEHRPVLVAPPVGSGHARQLECPDRAGRIGMAAAAEVGKRADRIERDRFALGDLACDLNLIRVALEGVDGLVSRDLAAGHRVIRGHDLVHPLLQTLEVLGRERVGPIEIVVESVLDRRPNGRFGFGEQILNGIGEYVSRGMPQLRKSGHIGAVPSVLRSGAHPSTGSG